MGSDGKKKTIIIGVASVLLVAMVIGTVVSVTRKGGDSGGDSGGKTSVTTKAVETVCQPTDYKDACVKSLSSAKNTSDPKELIKTGFNVAVDEIRSAIANSSTLQKAAKDPRTTSAFEVCNEVLDESINDLKRSFDTVAETFELSKVDDYVSNLKVWLSAVLTYQETCIDAFDNTTGDSGEKMKGVLKLAHELSSNCLAMVTDFSHLLSSLSIPGISRRLMSEEENNNEDFPAWVDHTKRKILQAAPGQVKPNAVVAQDGSGTHKSIQEAIATVPPKNNQTFVILVKAGIYKEYVTIPKKVFHIVLMGEGRDKTVITGNKNFADGVTTFRTATVVVDGDHFMAKDIGFDNSAGAIKHQAVALRVSADESIFFNCKLTGYQDTLYAHTYRQFYRNCVITGTIDFIFGDAQAVFQNCTMMVRKPMENQGCMVTAQGRKDKRGMGGIILQNCHITAEPEFIATKPPIKAYLGRPWKEFSRTIIMTSDIDSIIVPEGWSPWAGTFALDTCFYAEVNNRGPGADLAHRVTWPCIQKLTPQQAEEFTPGPYIQGDIWIKPTGIPYDSGMAPA